MSSNSFNDIYEIYRIFLRKKIFQPVEPWLLMPIHKINVTVTYVGM